MNHRHRKRSALANWLICLLANCLIASCANIVPPTGGAQDQTAPRLRAVSPADSQLNTRVTKITLLFDEFVALDNPAAQVQLSPLPPIPLDVQVRNRTVIVRIPDSLLAPATTYRITFGNAIRDVHEGNPFGQYSYTFSTGAYFDSLALRGQVINAATGLPDSAATVVLYEASAGDSAIFRQRPRYATHTDASGSFALEGLPGRPFRIYALRDANNNLTYEGGAEWIAFSDSLATPRPDSPARILLRAFPERDTVPGNDDTTAAGRRFTNRRGTGAAAPTGSQPYTVLADTGNVQQRTQNIARPLRIAFATRPKTFNPDKVLLFADSAGALTERPATIAQDSAGNISITTPWLEDTRYELRLQKGFAQDTAGADLLGGRWAFRTRRASDYAKLSIRVDSSYLGGAWVLQVAGTRDTIYQKPVTAPLVPLSLLEPGAYRLLLIKDDNRNGVWDTGDLSGKKQPELVVPGDPQTLKAGWEHNVDFVPPEKRGRGKRR